MSKSLKVVAASFALLSLFVVAAYSSKAPVEPQAQYPVMNKVADKVIQKYQQTSCEGLWLKKSEKAPPTPEEQQAIVLLKGDKDMRTAFINKVAPPIVNKMFDCGMIP
jgi:hypothetical protein